ncbi:hypothetical protein QWY75_06635 [Pontixanthobacter aestiaquae]|uniref:CorA-like Mg2+ transporter protein n=1 Tax=Pontixanthobacter aestiaquae TaxID=1509367 RepID=A0A844Z5R4_9SPHN|nr:hypothetical protein [Pontixanthobacter aestiaquae]MDN3645878.1 hypothetical protein [Pontixanthobacter aestiaquae]MXO83128.1 hypothetical protein [Pontixanthobacter aestiaquae]
MAQNSRQVVFNAPLHTGIYLDSRRAALDSFGAVQQAVTDASMPVGAWDIARSKVRQSGLQIDVDDRRGVTILPRYIAERRLTGEDLSAALVALSLPATLKDESGTAAFHVEQIIIRQLEFGYATMLAYGRLECPNCSAIKEFRGLVEGISSQVPIWTPLAQETADALIDAIPAEFLLQAGPQSNIPAPIMRQRENDDIRMLWVHRIFRFERSDPLVDEAKEVEALVFRHEPDDVRNLAIDDDYDFYVGVGNSLVIADKEAFEADLDLVPRVVSMQNAYWARIESFDVELFHYINALSSEVDQRNISGFDKIQALEEKSQEIVDLLEYAELFRSAYNDYSYHLDPQSRVLWQEIISCWGTNNRFEAINDKLATLEKMYDRVRGSLRSLYDSQLNTFVIIFTLFGLLSVMVDVVDFVQESSFRGIDILRLGILGTMALILVVFGYTVLRRKTPL